MLLYIIWFKIEMSINLIARLSICLTLTDHDMDFSVETLYAVENIDLK